METRVFKGNGTKCSRCRKAIRRGDSYVKIDGLHCVPCGAYLHELANGGNAGKAQNGRIIRSSKPFS